MAEFSKDCAFEQNTCESKVSLKLKKQKKVKISKGSSREL